MPDLMPGDHWSIFIYSSVLEKNLRLVMECVDELTQDSNKYFNYQRQAAKQTMAKTQYTQKRVCINSWVVCSSRMDIGDI